MSSCVLALARHPDVQRRFQAEVDKFVAENNRLPTTTDRDDPAFAYVRAVISEVERFAPVAPIGEWDSPWRLTRVLIKCRPRTPSHTGRLLRGLPHT